MIMLMIMIIIKIAAITMLRYYVNSRRNIDLEKSKSQMRLEPTTLHDLVRCFTTELLETLW